MVSNWCHDDLIENAIEIERKVKNITVAIIISTEEPDHDKVAANIIWRKLFFWKKR